MGCPCLSSCLLRQMSAVSAVITAQLNINDSLAWQVLAGQRRGERGMPLDKTKDEKEKWWLYLLDRFSFVCLNLRICMCAISRFLAWHDGFIALFFFPSEELNLFVFPLPLILPTGIADIPSSICVCARVCIYMCVSAAIYVQVCVCFLHILMCFLGKSILDFDVGNRDGGDARSQWGIIPEGRVVRGEEDGQSRGGEAKWNERSLLVEGSLWFIWIHSSMPCHAFQGSALLFFLLWSPVSVSLLLF